MAHGERRSDSGRRAEKDRRHEGSGMISAYVGYSGPERRNSIVRRGMSERRVVTP